MRRIELGTVRLVAAKELLESIRDRRTLFVALVLPVLLYPLVTLGIGSIVSLQKRRLAESDQPIALTGAGAQEVRALVLDPPHPPGAATPPERPALAVVASADPAADLGARRIALWIEADGGFAENLRAQGTGVVRARYDGSDDRSLEAWTKWRAAFHAASRRVLAERLARQGLPPSWTEPIVCEEVNVAPPERTSAWAFGKLLPLLLVLMTLTSSFYPAVDAVAGEKERGTMETLLVAPCGRAELVLGKFVAVLAVTLASAVLNLASLALTAGPALSAVGGSRLPPLEITWGVVGGILLLLLPLAALFSAVSVSVSTLARSIKEAQHYLTPIVVLVMPLAMVVVLPNLTLTPTLAAVPVANAVLFFRDLMVGRTEWSTTAIVFTSTFGFAALAIWASVALFLKEETLFRGPEGSGGRLFARPAPRERPTAGAAVFLFAASLAILWYSQARLPEDIVMNVLVTQLAVVVGPCIALALWLRVRPVETFRAGLPREAAAALLLAVPVGITLPVVNLAARHALFGPSVSEGPFKALEIRFEALVREESATTLVLLVAVLPALCEELVYRGFILSGLRGRGGGAATARAVVLSAVLFALFHVFPEKWVTTFPVGLVLAYVCVRTGSLWPGVVIHGLNNASAVLAAKYGAGTALESLYAPEDPRNGTAVAVTTAVLAAALASMHWVTRRAPLPATTERDAP